MNKDGIEVAVQPYSEVNKGVHGIADTLLVVGLAISGWRGNPKR